MEKSSKDNDSQPNRKTKAKGPRHQTSKKDHYHAHVDRGGSVSIKHKTENSQKAKTHIT